MCDFYPRTICFLVPALPPFFATQPLHFSFAWVFLLYRQHCESVRDFSLSMAGDALPRERHLIYSFQQGQALEVSSHRRENGGFNHFPKAARLLRGWHRMSAPFQLSKPQQEAAAGSHNKMYISPGQKNEGDWARGAMRGAGLPGEKVSSQKGRW